MRKWLILFTLVPALAQASPQDGYYQNPQGALMGVSAASDAGFDFSVVVGAPDGGSACPEGEVACLQVDGHAEAGGKGFVYIDAGDDHSRIFFAQSGTGLRILSTTGDLGTGSANRAQMLALTGIYAPVADESAPSAPDAPAAPDASAAADGTQQYFQSPTGNIVCLLDYADEGYVRCDILQLNRSFTQTPDDCTEDWGDSFTVTETSRRGEVLCHGDTVAMPDAQVLEYGQTLTDYGIACTSSKSGMSCETDSGHGFAIARKQQQVY